MANEISADGKNTKQEKDLLQSLTRLNELTGKQVSIKHRFLLGMIQGVGTAIGATILAGLLFAFLASSLATAQSIPWLTDLVQSINWEQYLDRTNEGTEQDLPQSTEDNSATTESNDKLIESIDKLNETIDSWTEKKEETEKEVIEDTDSKIEGEVLE